MGFRAMQSKLVVPQSAYQGNPAVGRDGDGSANTHIFKCGKREESALPSLPRNSKKAVSPSFLTTFVQDRHEAPGRSNVDLSAGDPPPFFAIAPHSPGPRRTGRRAGGPALCSRLERKGEVPIEGEVS